MKKFVLLSALVLVGCGDSTPKCDDSTATGLAKQIITTNYFGGIMPFKFFEADISNIRASGFNKDIGVYTCKAHFSGKFGPAATKDDSSAWSAVEKEIIYTVQLNSDGDVSVEAQW